MVFFFYGLNDFTESVLRNVNVDDKSLLIFSDNTALRSFCSAVTDLPLHFMFNVVILNKN
jgi:hypothetical protein